MKEKRKNYRVQHHARECRICRFVDSIKERKHPLDQSKVTVVICQLDHTPVELSGVCDTWKAAKQ